MLLLSCKLKCSSFTVPGHELQFVDELYTRNEKGQSFSTSSFSGSQNIPAKKQRRRFHRKTTLFTRKVGDERAEAYLPSSRGRIVLCWISVMCSKPISLTPFSVFSLTSSAREANDVSSNAPVKVRKVQAKTDYVP